MKFKKLLTVLKETAQAWVADNAMRLSAALSLYTILSLAPLLVLTLKIVALVWRNADATRTYVMHQTANLMGTQAASAIQQMLDNGAKQGNGATAAIISTVILLFSATGVFGELQDSMNTIWGVKPKPNQGIWSFVKNRLLSMAMVFGIAFLLLVSMFVSTVLTMLVNKFAGDAGWVAFLAEIVVSFGVITVLFAAIFKFLPDVKLQWKHVWLGAAITTALFILGKYGLGLYFKYATPTSPFGAAGSLAAVLLWVYYSSFILFFGAEFTKIWALHHARKLVATENAQPVVKQEIPQKEIVRDAVEPAHSAHGNGRRIAAPRVHAIRSRSRAVAPWSIGAFIGGLGAGFLAARNHRELETSIRSAQLHDRLHKIEDILNCQPLGKAALKYAGIQQRIRDVEQRVRRALR